MSTEKEKKHKGENEADLSHLFTTSEGRSGYSEGISGRQWRIKASLNGFGSDTTSHKGREKVEQI